LILAIRAGRINGDAGELKVLSREDAASSLERMRRPENSSLQRMYTPGRRH
jgi:hypothetical protein